MFVPILRHVPFFSVPNREWEDRHKFVAKYRPKPCVLSCFWSTIRTIHYCIASRGNLRYVYRNWDMHFKPEWSIVYTQKNRNWFFSIAVCRHCAVQIIGDVTFLSVSYQDDRPLRYLYIYLMQWWIRGGGTPPPQQPIFFLNFMQFLAKYNKSVSRRAPPPKDWHSPLRKSWIGNCLMYTTGKCFYTILI